MNPSRDLTIVTSCSGYGKYLKDWAESIVRLSCKPAYVVIVTHGSIDDQQAGECAQKILCAAEIAALHDHSPNLLDFGVARNRAVSRSQTEWVMHLDCDDTLLPHALDDIAALAPEADVVALGYIRTGDLKSGPSNRTRHYRDVVGLEALTVAAPCSGVSPYRRSFWERSPYRTDMKGAWDTALWIGFARLGARFRATTRPCFEYRQHADSIFNKRRTTLDWTYALTTAQLRSLRRNDAGVAVIVPRDPSPSAARLAGWKIVRDHYSQHHSQWPVHEGFSPTQRWIKGDAIVDALTRASSADVLVIADADCLVAPTALEDAVRRVQTGAPWAIPHESVLRLSAAAMQSHAPLFSTRVWSEQNDWIARDQLVRPPYIGYAGGGIFVVRRVHYDASGGIPKIFEGWGGEDQAIAIILDCLVGPHYRGKADLIHLWHEPQPTKKVFSKNSHRFRLVKQAATRGPNALIEILQQLPHARQLGKTDPPWLRRSLEKQALLHGVALKDRQAYLARNQQKGARGQ